ncbi:MAG TPA: zf-HC2 domain-containing protein [Candidatus Baltobacteraceae bacterium]|jgi:anti-sigma factor RsiW
MRCNTSENLFDGLLDGTLSTLQRHNVETHLASCARCTSVLEELRVIDALLLTPRLLESVPNFTQKTMAEIRTMPAPKPAAPRLPLWMAFGFYLLVSWLGIGTWIAFGRPNAHGLFSLALGLLDHSSRAVQDVARVVAAGVGSTGIASIVALVLGVDILLIALAFFAPRVISRMARNEPV